MDPRHIALVQESFEKAEPFGETVSRVFSEELKRFLPRDTQAAQDHDTNRLLRTFAVAVRSLHAPQSAMEDIRLLTAGHFERDTRPEHYSYVGNALLRTLKRVLGVQFTPDLWEAWVEALCVLSNVVAQRDRESGRDVKAA